MTRVLAAAALLAALALSIESRGHTAVVEAVHLRVPGADERNAAVSGELRIPESSRERMPVVVIVNTTVGFDGRGADYAAVLNEAGIATFEIGIRASMRRGSASWDSRGARSLRS